MFGVLKKALGAGSREVAAAYGENKDFLEAVCASVALVAAADGDIEETERQKATRLIINHPDLSRLYKQTDIEQTLDAMFKRAKEASGRQQLAREIDDIKSRPNAAKMAEDVYLIALDIAGADGEVEAAEDAVLRSSPPVSASTPPGSSSDCHGRDPAPGKAPRADRGLRQGEAPPCGPRRYRPPAGGPHLPPAARRDPRSARKPAPTSPQADLFGGEP